MAYEAEVNKNGSIDIYKDDVMVDYISATKVKKMVENIELDPEDLEVTAVIWAEKNL